MLLLFAGTLLASCSVAADEPPEITVDHSACAHCSMLISEPRYAAAYRVDGRDRLFDDIGCMLAALGEESDPAAARVWVGDVDSGNLLDAAQAVFVRAEGLATPMAGGVVAFDDREAAGALAARQGGEVLTSFGDLRNVFTQRAARTGRETEGHR